MTGHADPVAFVALALAIILASAKLAGDLAERVGQPAVLGELLAGIVLGNLHLAGVSWMEPIKADATIDVLAHLKIILLLFEIDLESTVRDILQMKPRSLIVAMLNVATP